MDSLFLASALRFGEFRAFPTGYLVTPGRVFIASDYSGCASFLLRFLDILVYFTYIILVFYYRVARCDLDGVILFRNSRRSENFGRHF